MQPRGHRMWRKTGIGTRESPSSSQITVVLQHRLERKLQPEWISKQQRYTFGTHVSILPASIEDTCDPSCALVHHPNIACQTPKLAMRFLQLGISECRIRQTPAIKDGTLAAVLVSCQLVGIKCPAEITHQTYSESQVTCLKLATASMNRMTWSGEWLQMLDACISVPGLRHVEI